MSLLLDPRVQAFLISIRQLAIWLAIIVAVFVPIERLFALERRQILRKGIFVDLAYYFLSGLLPAILLSVPIAFLALIVRNLIPGSFLAMTAALPLWARVMAGLVAGEVGYYWGHRWCHEIPFLWRFHAIHHSAEEVDFLVNSRSHPLDMVFGRFCGLVPIYLLGLGGPIGEKGTLVPALASLFGTLWGFFIHANVRWRFGPLEWLISTPAFHHWHHTKTGPINKNYASTLPWLDRLFGTHHLPANEWPESYGIRANDMPESLIDQLFYPLAEPVKTSPDTVEPVEPTPPHVLMKIANHVES